MKPDLCRSKAMLDEIADLIRKNHRRDIQPFTETFLVKSLEKRLTATSIDSAATYVLHLADDGAEAEALIHSLNIGYSVFFRDSLVFALLGQRVLPGLIQEKDKSGRAEIRICSGGADPDRKARHPCGTELSQRKPHPPADPERCCRPGRAWMACRPLRKFAGTTAARHSGDCRHLQRHERRPGGHPGPWF